jgi:excinuclease UvrABC nuclease subunit
MEFLLKDRNQFPKSSGIYFILRASTVLYIGRTKNLYQRWRTYSNREHHKHKYLNETDIVLFVSLAELLKNNQNSLLSTTEHRLIKTFKPVLNERLAY